MCEALPGTRSLIAVCVRLARDNFRSRATSNVNTEMDTAIPVLDRKAVIAPYPQPLDWNPCLGCNLCVAACPVGAIHNDGSFDFGSCYTHTYGQFVSNFASGIQPPDGIDAAPEPS